jgi:hypothetical protein
MDGTENNLVDGFAYDDAPLDENLEEEDQKATFFSEGQLIFDGEGTLNLTSLAKNALCSDEYIRITSGTINVISAMKNGTRTNEGFELQGGNVTITAYGNAVNGDESYVHHWRSG